VLTTPETPKPTWKQALYARRFPDRAVARIQVNEAVKYGRMPRAKDLLCVDCLTPAREYDHYLGYAKEHWFDVQAVCRSCHLEREKRRRPNCKRGHRYTNADWREVNGRKVRMCRECTKLYGQPGFVPVDGRGPKVVRV
jgi:hypothetical protein